MVEIIEHGGLYYPAFQKEGHASQFAIPFAKHLCKGEGLDIGCMKKEWAFPGATPIDLDFDDEWHAMNLPDKKYDYIFSSHCVEHINDWVGVLDYWREHLKSEGVLFLYLPHYSQTYWRPWHNRKHVNVMSPLIIYDYFKDRDYRYKWVTGPDLNNSFYAVAVK
tara:strand:+ start:2535 stop:3026 length:492 start_codon:yes stop_codon:yes gene_type:complete